MNHKLSINFKGKTLSGYAQMVQGKLWVHFQGQTFISESAKSSRQRRGAEGKSSKSLIHAPMPGKVTRIFVEPQQAIEAGQAVIVMEAMKMEYTLKSELSTTVDSVSVSVGDQVQLGQVLVTLKEPSAETDEVAGK